MTSYFTHDNGGRPFRVNISADGKSVEVYKRVECTDGSSAQTIALKKIHTMKNPPLSGAAFSTFLWGRVQRLKEPNSAVGLDRNFEATRFCYTSKG